MSARVPPRKARRLEEEKYDGRAGYFLDGAFRPAWRGHLIEVLATNNRWLKLGAIYVTVVGYCVMQQPEASRTKGWQYILGTMGFRIAYIGATTWQIHASDWLHNLDKKISHYFTVYRDDNDKTRLLKKKAVETELGCFGKDMVSISLAMTTSQLLWSSTLGWVAGLGWCGAGTVACTAGAHLLTSHGMVLPSTPWSEGIEVKKHVTKAEMATKAILGLQFFGFLSYMAKVAQNTSNLQQASAVWTVYLPGFVFFGLKKVVPSTALWSFGPHEMFHIFVILGHLATCVLDARYWLNLI